MEMMINNKNDVVVHVAIIPNPGTGHLIPHLQLVKRLVVHSSFNIRVTFFVLSTESSTAQTHLLLQSQTLPSPNLLRIVHLPPTPNPSATAEIQARISIIIRESLPHIHSALTPDPPNVLVVDFFSTDAFQIADQFGKIPKFIFFTSPASSFAFMTHLPTLDRIVKGQFSDLQEPIHVPGCNPIRIEDLIETVRDRNRESYKWFLYHASRFCLADGILVNTCQYLEPTALEALNNNPDLPSPPVYPVGPLIKCHESSSSPSASTDKGEWMTWLDLQPLDSVLFVSFGSGGTLSVEQLAELAWGLELSQQRFVWVVRKPFETEEATRKFLNVAEEHNNPSMYLPDGFLDRVRGRGMVVPSWAPQVEILNHGSTGGFLSHCGWNSSLESIYYGVPLITWPLYAEQKMNATMLVEEIGIAVRGKTGKEKDGVVRREEIERVVRLVMEGEEGKCLRRRAGEVREGVLRDVGEGGSSSISLSQVANGWKSTRII